MDEEKYDSGCPECGWEFDGDEDDIIEVSDPVPDDATAWATGQMYAYRVTIKLRCPECGNEYEEEWSS